MDEIGIDKNQVACAGDVFPVVKEEYPFSFYDIEDFVLSMKMLDAHVKFAVTDHLFQCNSVGFAVVGDFFHMGSLSENR